MCRHRGQSACPPLQLCCVGGFASRSAPPDRSRSYVLQAISFETDAYAIIDTFRWIEPKIYTLVIGEAFGNAALIVAAGELGLHRLAGWHTCAQHAAPATLYAAARIDLAAG